MNPDYLLSNYDYNLPQSLIAWERGDGPSDRLLVWDRRKDEIRHLRVRDILEYLDKNVLVIFNDTRVIPARLLGVKEKTGGKVDVVLLSTEDGFEWKALIKPRMRLKPGQRILFEGAIWGVYEGGDRIRFEEKVDIPLLERIGRMPLPPYIKRVPEERDKQMYQPVYARHYGAIAAPTAGLHFDRDLLDQIERKSAGVEFVTLHVGYGTFAPIRVEDIRKHRMHREWVSVNSAIINRIHESKKAGKEILAIGTTVVRVLETIADEIYSPTGRNVEMWTDLFIYPGFEFRVVDHLFTNFHLPKSSLLILVSAFAGREKVLSIYKEAVRQKYRFFSYGDAMLIW